MKAYNYALTIKCLFFIIFSKLLNFLLWFDFSNWSFFHEKCKQTPNSQSSRMALFVYLLTYLFLYFHQYNLIGSEIRYSFCDKLPWVAYRLSCGNINLKNKEVHITTLLFLLRSELGRLTLTGELVFRLSIKKSVCFRVLDYYYLLLLV